MEAPGEFGPQIVHKPFSPMERKQIKADLGSYSDHSDGYINIFQYVTLVYDLSWKDTMIILGQTLLDAEQERVLREVGKHANGFHMSDPKCHIGETVYLP